MHPRQVPVINTAFSPSHEEIGRARAVVAAGESTGLDIATTDGQMVGRPFFAAAAALVCQVDGEHAAGESRAEGEQR